MGNLTYTIDRGAGIVRLHYTGAPEWSEMKEVLEAVLRDPDHRPGDGFLADRSRIVTPQTAGYIQKIVSFVRHHQDGFGAARWALVVKGGAPYGMGRMAQALGDDIAAMDLELFEDPAEAERWLREGPARPRSAEEAS
jgi:hypothetical protein